MGGAKRNHSPSDVSDSHTAVELNMRRSDSMSMVSGCRSGAFKRRKAKTDPVVASAASALEVGAAASAASRSVRTEERNAAAGSAITTHLQKYVLSMDNASLQAARGLLGLGGECGIIFFVLVAENACLEDALNGGWNICDRRWAFRLLY